MGYTTFKNFPMIRFNSSQQYIVLTIRPEKRTAVHGNVRFMCMTEFESMDTTEFILVGGYTMFRLLHDRIHHVFRYHVYQTCNECDIFE